MRIEVYPKKPKGTKMSKKIYEDWLTPDDLERLGMKKGDQAKKRMEYIQDKYGNKILNPYRLPYSKIGKFVIYKREEIEKYFEEHSIC